MSSFTLSTRYADQNTAATIEYFDCEKSGQNNTHTCSLDIVAFPLLNLMSYILLGFFPAINLIFTVNAKELKIALKQLHIKMKTFTVLRATGESTLSTLEKQ